MSLRPCPVCGGARLRAESRAVLVGGTRIEDFCALSARRALEWLEEVELSETDRHVARLILREISERLRFLENVGIGYLSMDRASATLSGGEAQRIRLATQIGSSLVGVLYILDEPSIGLHQRDNSKLIATLERLRDLGNTVIVVEHDEQTMRAADHLVDLGPGAGEHGGRIVAQGTAAQVQRVKDSLTGQFLAGTRTIAPPAKRRVPTGYLKVKGATQHNLRDVDASFALGTLTCVTGRLGLGQVDARQRDPLQGAGQPPAPRAPAPGCAPLDRGARAARQDHRRRPVPDRAHAALEPRDLHGPVRRDPRPLLEDAGGARARLQAGPLLLQRQGRALRGLQGRRADQDRDALPARRLRAVRAVPRQALQPRDARDPLQGQVDRRRPRHADRAGREVLRAHPQDPPAPGDAERGRSRLRAPRPARDDALRRGGAAREARDGALEGRDRPHAVHPRRAHDGPALRRRAAPARGAAAAGRRRQQRGRDRAQPRRHQVRGPPHRHGSGGRRRGRHGDRGRHSRGGRGRAGLAHRALPRRAAAARPACRATAPVRAKPSKPRKSRAKALAA